jgi:diadenosine tetraphosphatase ApaH/serine/threonine PP2A family protein phosphatase
MKSEKLQYPIAVLSDVCANLEALEAVLADIQTQDVNSILFLGDAIGYGPNPAECLDLLRDTACVYLLGRLETALLEIVFKNEPSPFNDPNLLGFPLERLKKLREPKRGRERRLDWLSNRPETVPFEMIYALHTLKSLGTIFPDRHLARAKELLAEHFKSHQFVVLSGNQIPWYSCLGATEDHIIKDTRSVPIDFIVPTIVSPGSVGQPRDNNPKACYLIFSEHELVWRRVDYNIKKTVEKIKAIPELREIYGKRLEQGI